MTNKKQHKHYSSPILFMIAAIAIFMLWGNHSLTRAQDFTLPNIESGKVVLSWAELKLLLEEIETLRQANAEKKADQEKKEDIPPAEYSIGSAQYEGTIQGETARFKSDFSVQVLKQGWIKIPFFAP